MRTINVWTLHAGRLVAETRINRQLNDETLHSIFTNTHTKAEAATLATRFCQLFHLCPWFDQAVGMASPGLADAGITAPE